MCWVNLFENVQSVNFRMRHESNFDGKYCRKKLIRWKLIKFGCIMLIKSSNSISIVKKEESSEKYY